MSYKPFTVTAEINGTDSSDGCGKMRVRLSETTDAQYSRCQVHGVEIRAIHVGVRWVIVHTYSVWESGRRDGSCVGSVYTAYDLTSERDRSDLLDYVGDCNEVVEAIDKKNKPIDISKN